MKTNLKHISRRTVSLILCVLMLFSTLMVGTITANAYTVYKGTTVYFDATDLLKTYTDIEYVYFAVSYQDNYTLYEMSKISGSNLYYHKRTDDNFNNNDRTTFFATTSSWGSSGGNYDNMNTYGKWVGGKLGRDYGASDVLFVKPDSTSKECNLTTSSTLNPTQTAALKVDTGSGTYGTLTEGNPGTVKVEGKSLSDTSFTSVLDTSSATDADASVSACKTSTVTLTYTATDSSYEFVGWSTDSSESNIFSTDTTYSYTVSNSTSSETKHYALVKKNAPSTCTVSFDVNGGNETCDSVTVDYGDPYPDTELPTVTKEGYTFAGWYNGDTQVQVSDLTSITSNISLKAKWEEVLHTVNISGGTTTSTTAGIATVGTATVDIPDGYTFKNWTIPTGIKLVDDTSATSETIKFNTTSDDLTVTANYEEDLTTTWYLIGGFNSWKESDSDYKFVKESGGTGFATLTYTFTTTDSIEFKLFDSSISSGSKYFSNSPDKTAGSITVNEPSAFSVQGGGDNNVTFTPPRTGEYTFKFNLDTKELTIVPPPAQKFAVTFSGGTGSPDVTATVNGVEIESGDEVAEGTEVVVTGVPKDGYVPAELSAWQVTGSTGTASDDNLTYTFTVTQVTNIVFNTVESTDYGKAFVDDYTIGNTWIKPGDSTTITVKSKKTHSTPLCAKYKAFAYYGENNTLIGESDFVQEDNLGKKISFSAINFSSDTVGVYPISVKILGYNDAGEVVTTDSEYFTDATRKITVSNDPAKVELTARLELTALSGNVADEAGTPISIEQGETVTLHGFCNNGNKAAGEYTANCADTYLYNFYYYTDTDNTPVKIGETQTSTANKAVIPVTEKSIDFTVPEDAAENTKYYFYVTIEAQYNGNIISDPCSSELKGLIEGNVIVPTVKTPAWAETGSNGLVYFHTVGDNISYQDAWVAMEVVLSGVDTAPRAGTYSDSSQYCVFLPDCARNSDNTYLVYNARDTKVTFKGTDTVEIPAGGTGYIKTDSSKVLFGDSATECNLSLNISKAEENVYINTNDTTLDVTNAAVTQTSSAFISALGFDGSKGEKTDVNISSPSFTLVQSNGKVDFSGIGKNIKGRGNTTWKNTQKKSFNINTNVKCSISGMAKSKKYSLLANFQDPSLSRNRFLYDLADSVGIPFSSDSRYAEVYVNGVYVGAYLLTEKYDDIEGLADPVYNADGTLAGDIDFMIELACSSQGDEHEITPSNNSGILSVTLPDPEDYIANETTKNAIGSYIKGKYDALYSALTNSSTTEAQLEELIDVESLAKVYLINELGKNYDSGVSSFYLTFKNGKFVASPVWDYDNSLGNNPSAGVNNAVTDYGDPDGWWCKYWKGNGQSYNGNFMYQSANSTVVMNAAKRVWFGTSKDDSQSFVNAIRNFNETTSTSVTLGKNTGLQSKDYYYSVLSASASNNYKKWSIMPGGSDGWVSGHGSRKTYTLDYDTYLEFVNFDTHKLKSSVDENSEEYTSTLTTGNNTYNENVISGQYDYASDWMVSRAAWLTYQFMGKEHYYVAGAKFGGWSSLANAYEMTETYDGSGIYTFEVTDKANLQGTNYWKLNNGSVYIGPTSDTNGENVTLNSDNGFTTTSVKLGSNVNSYIASGISDSWTTVDVCYQPSENKIWLANHTTTSYTVPTISVTPATQFVAEGSMATITATVTSGSKVTTDGVESDYSGNYVFKLYSSSGEVLETITGASAEFNTNAFINAGEYTFTVKAYPELATNPSEATSDPATAKVTYKYIVKNKDVTYYVDMHADSSLTPTINFKGGAALALSLIDGSTVYRGTYSTPYYVTSETSTEPAAMATEIESITTGSKTLPVSNTNVLNKKCITTGEVWLEAITSIADAEEVSGATAKGVTYKTPTTKRIYASIDWEVSGWSSLYMHYFKDGKVFTTWPGKAMTRISGTNNYYLDIESDATTMVLSSNGSPQTANIPFGTDNSFTVYNNANKNGYEGIAWQNQSADPTPQQYADTLETYVGGTVSIESTINDNVTATYTSADKNIATVDESGNVTAVSTGTTTITVKTTGSNKDVYTTTCTVTVINKSVGTDAYAIMSYQSGSAEFTAKNGTVGDLTVTLNGSKYPEATTGGIVNGKIVTYAVPDSTVSGYADISVSVATNATANAQYKFVNWTKNGTEVSTVEKLNVTLNTATNDVYQAVFDLDSVKMVFIYNFEDFDTSDGNFEYDASKPTKSSSYTTSVKLVPQSVLDNTATLKEYSEKYAPSIVSQYFEYEIDENSTISEPVSSGDVYYVQTKMSNIAREYKVSIGGSDNVVATVNFQQEVILNAADYYKGNPTDSYVWYKTADLDKPNKTPLSDKSVFALRVAYDIDLTVAAAEGNEVVKGLSVINAAYHEIKVIDGKQYLGQNFYIQDFYRDPADGTIYKQDGSVADKASNMQFVGAGTISYVATTSTLRPVDPTVRNYKYKDRASLLEVAQRIDLNSENLSNQTDSKSGMYYSFVKNSDTIDDQTNTAFLKYSNSQGCYNYFYEAMTPYDPIHMTQSYVVYSFYVYSYDVEGQADPEYVYILSNNYATAKVYEAAE
ncbi:MAG: CotH kinase family protein [Ruminococcus sp.]